MAVVGAGPGGLAAAVLLAGRGLDVHLYEAADRPGGRARGRVVHGYVLESGPVFFHGPWVLEKLLARVGARREDWVPIHRVKAPGFRYRFEDGRHVDVCPDLDAVAAQFEAIEPGAGASLRRFVERARGLVSPGMELMMSRPMGGLLQQFFGLHMRYLWRHKPWTDLRSLLRAHFKTPDLRTVLALPCAYLGAPPARVSSAMSIVPAMELDEGFFYPEGGFAGMAEGMLRCFGALNGHAWMGRPVEKILCENRQVTAIEVAGERLGFDAVVVNADLPQACRTLLPEDARPHLSDRRLGRMRYSASAYVLSVGLRRAPAEIAAPYTVDIVPEPMAEGFHDRPELTLDPARPLAMMACPSVTSPALAPAGGASIQLSAIVPNLDHPVDWAAQRAALRETLLARMERALPGSRAEIVEELEIAPPQWRDSFRVERGAVFSFAHDNQQVGSFRPHNRSKKLRNLYWVGGGTHPGSGIFPILLSSVIADDLIAEDGIGRKPPPWRLQVAG